MDAIYKRSKMSKDMCFEKAFSGELASNPPPDGVLDLGALNAEKYVILSESNQSILPLLRERVGVRVLFFEFLMDCHENLWFSRNDAPISPSGGAIC